MSEDVFKGLGDCVRLEPDGLYLYRRAAVGAPHVRSAADEDVFPHLRRPCLVAAGVSLGDVMRFVEGNAPLADFLARYSWCRHLPEFNEHARRSPRDPGRVERLEVVRSGILHYADGSTGWFESCWHFRGIGTAVEGDAGHSPGEEMPIGVSTMGLDRIAQLPLRVVPKSPVFVLGKGVRGVSYDTEGAPSLLELLDAIYWSISFHGGPEDREMWQERLQGGAQDRPPAQ